MCGTSASADRLLVVHEARVAADELVERFLRLPVAKAMNLGTRAGFDRAVALLAAQLRRATGRAEVEAVREAIFSKVRAEYVLTREAVLSITGQTGIAERFPMFRDRFERVRGQLDRINALQVELLAEVRRGKRTEAAMVPLLQSMNCIAAGLGWTG